MNRSLSPYTPRIRALNYDALKNRRGCQTITGTGYFALMAFTRLCLGRPDDFTADERAAYEKPRTVSYCDGPAADGVPEPDKFHTRWAAWVATAGVRVGKYSAITPPDNTDGAASALYPNTKPTHLSIGFNEDALMAIAIQKTATTVEIKRFTDTGGTIATKDFAGMSPVLWNDWLLYWDLDNPGADLVCYYLKDTTPNVLYARFERDGFSAEYVIHTGLPADIGYLVSAEVFEDFKEQLLAIAPNGDFINLTSDQYYLHKTEVITDGTTMDGGVYFLSVYEQDIGWLGETETLTVAMTGGSTSALYDQDITALREVGTLTVAMTGGLYSIG